MGERLGWFRLASHLKIPVSTLQKSTSSSEFIEWMVYLEEEVNDFHRDSFYWAQIAAEIRRANSRNPKSVKTEDFLLKFTKKKEKSSEERISESKAAWFAAANAAKMNQARMRAQKKKKAR